jgi:stage II sporulation protein AA (anti-sigma F factor antagonist)
VTTTADVVVRSVGTTVDIAVGGEIDLANAAVVEEQIAAAVTNRVTAVTIDLGGLAYIDSAGLHVLFALVARLEVLQIALHVHVPPGSLARRVLELSGFGTLVDLDSPRGAVEPTAGP